MTLLHQEKGDAASCGFHMRLFEKNRFHGSHAEHASTRYRKSGIFIFSKKSTATLKEGLLVFMKIALVHFFLFLQNRTRGNMGNFPISSGGGQFTFVPLTLWYKFAIKYVLDFSWEEKFWPSVPTWGVVFFIQSSFKFVLYLVMTSYSPNSLAF